MSIDELLAAARSHAKITTLRGVKAEGAEGYLQAIAYIDGGNDGLSGQQLRDMALDYLEVTVDRQWQRRRYFEGAAAAQAIVAQLQ